MLAYIGLFTLLYNHSLWHRNHAAGHLFISLKGKETNNDIGSHPYHLSSMCVSSTSRPSTVHLTTDDQGGANEPIVVNTAETATFMLAWPSIATFTLVQGWKNDDEEYSRKLKQAVNTIIDRNPILAGKAQMMISQTFFPKVEISITPNAFPTSKHDFFHEIHIYSTKAFKSISEMSETEILSFMDREIAPLIPKLKSVLDLILGQKQLFDVHLIHLPGSYACYVVQMAHCIGDGVTYYNIMNEINRAFHNEDVVIPIDWRNEAIRTHEVFPQRFSRRDKDRAYGLAFFLGILKNVWNMKKERKIGYIILDKEKVETMRKVLLSKKDHDYLSANDIITSALCEANQSSDIFAFTMSMRGLHNRHLGGNFHNEIPFPRKIAMDPNQFRKILRKGFYYESNQIPLCPFVLGRVGRISNIATVQKLIQSENLQVLCHTMLSAFVENVPLDTAFICSMNHKHGSYVILHNFCDLHLDRGLIKDLIK